MRISDKRGKRVRRHKRVRAKIKGTGDRPRLSVFRSNRHLWTQLIDDASGKTIAAASDFEIKPQLGKKPPSRAKDKGTAFQSKPGSNSSTDPTAVGSRNGSSRRLLPGKGVGLALEVGAAIAEKAIKKKITKAVFDRGGYKYHGVVKAAAEGARKGGLKF